MSRIVPGSAHIPWGGTDGSSLMNLRGTLPKMPKGWKNPFREKLYQVMVEDREDGLIPVSPALTEDTANLVLHAAKQAIREGHRRNWANAHLQLHSYTA